MIQSMTGFGRGSRQIGQILLSAEIRSVNARQSDIRFKLPSAYRDSEHALRQDLQALAARGRVEVTIERRNLHASALGISLNESLYQHFRQRLATLEPALLNDIPALATAVLKMPNVIGTDEEVVDAAEQSALFEAFAEAVQDFVRFRKTEGDALEQDLTSRIDAILQALPEVETFEPTREQQMRQRLDRLITEQLTGTAVDRSRLEQEVLYYLEKTDISEEKARLRQHCQFFVESLHDQEAEKGRRLGFIAQEMGREINTLGAKAYSSSIQRVVVHMKDELEKIKEQLANVV